MTTLGRIVVALVALWFVVGLVAAILFASGGSAPPDQGRGRVIESPR